MNWAPRTGKCYIGAISAVFLVISYVIFIIVLYVFSGALSTGGEEWLKHITGHTAEWWSIQTRPLFPVHVCDV